MNNTIQTCIGLHPNLKYLNFFWNDITAIEHGFFDLFHNNITFADFRLNNCVELKFENTHNLGDSDAFEGCYENWDDQKSTTTSTTIQSTTNIVDDTTENRGGLNFKKIEVIFVSYITYMLLSYIRPSENYFSKHSNIF